ncbi:unnamed protein product [Symbiodinium natans]|uniref:Uncharacterized protein n=1 Tax=Symbiodinium natans TaxID=878477 RepID=A0A812KT32_9DINO|nr:unnamed protein product [Symbiodinium natans]
MGDEPERTDSAVRRGRDTEFQLRNAPRHYIDQSVQYLLLGVILGALGFIIAVIPMIIRGFTGTIGATNLRTSFLPATVSELVSQWDSVEARIFFGFELMAALCILLSWYPYKLRNASCIPAEGGCYIYCCGKCCSMSWAAARQFFPPVGLMLVACVPSVKEDEWSADKLVLVVVHCVSALLMFSSFLLAEAHALSLKPFRCAVQTLAAGSLEYKLRYGTWLLAALPYVVFTMIAVVDFLTDLHPYVKITSFVLEVDAGLAMLANHFVIWAFAPERTWSRREVEMSLTRV